MLPHLGVTKMETSEMREFFQRVVDHVNELTGTAAQVEGLRQQVQSLNDRVNQLEQSNYDLQQQLSLARSDSARLEAEVAQYQRDFDNERAVTNSLRETIVAADARVVSLQGDLKSEADSHTI